MTEPVRDVAGGAASSAGPAGPLEWSFNPWRERPARAALGAGLALGCCALVVSFGEPVVVTLGLCVVAVAAFAPLFAPARCRVGKDGVAVSGPLGSSLRRWEDIRRARLSSRGLFVSPYARRHPLDPWRALFLPLPGAAGGTLGGAVAARLREHELDA